MKRNRWWRRQVKKVTANPSQPEASEMERTEPITRESIERHLQNVDDVTINDFVANGETVTYVYIRSIVDETNIYQNILLPIQRGDGMEPERVLPMAEPIPQEEMSALLGSLIRGYTVLLFPQRNLVLKVNSFKVQHRSITNSETESTALGSQDSFVESLEINLSLIRRRMINPNLKIRTFEIGSETKSKVAILYLENIANPENVRRVIHRVQTIDYQGAVGLEILKQMLEDKPYSPFPQFGLTTRPDNAVAALLDGRILTFQDHSPEAAICPASFLELFNSPEDHYNRWATATLLRMIRFFGLFVTVLLTSGYVSVLTYHPEMLPPPLLLLLSESRSKVPFPPVVEALLIELVIEIQREAGIRMPTKIGQTVGIVGGIVLGTAAVEAGLASNILIVIVSVSALLSFLPPNFLMSNAFRIVRYGFILMAGIFGMYGQMLALAFLFAHLLSLTSLGTPYMTAGIPRIWTDALNSIIRAPTRLLFARSGIGRPQRDVTRPLDEE
ncbi:spore germination protein [Brevibacillus sp. H7]|uniref:spore germination protein n=1 Tax=Brevibacillus sp. H7 TaxID=3349138 RepID=UPI00380140A4